MDIYKTNLFRFVKGDMLKDRPAVLTIDTVKVTEMPNLRTGEVEEKYLLTFKESPKPLILNTTNANKLAKMFGRDTDAWAGQVVELFAEELKAFGKLHNAARIREAKQVKNARQSQKQAAESTSEERQERLKDNGNLLHGAADDTAIGEEPQIDPCGCLSQTAEDSAPPVEPAQDEFKF